MSYIPYETPPSYQERHSGVGITATVMGVVAIVIEFANLGLATAMAAAARTAPMKPSSQMMLGVIALGGGALAVVGLGLAIGSFFQTSRRKLFSILGLILNLLPILGVLALLAIGLAIKK